MVTRSPKPAGRSLKLTPTEVSQWVRNSAKDLELIEADKLKGNTELLSKLSALALDAYLVNSFGRIIPEEFLRLVKYPLCIHPSPLPQLRGPSPIRTALLLGMKRTGVALFRMTAEMDAGDVILFKEAEIYPQDNFASLRTRLAELAREVVEKGLCLIMDGAETYIPQDHSKATFTKLFSFEDTFLDFSLTAEDVFNRIRAFSPDMGAVCVLPDGKMLKIFSGRVYEEEENLQASSYSLGEVVRIFRENFIVACGKGFIEVTEVQPENKRKMSATEFLAGRKLKAGDILRKPS